MVDSSDEDSSQFASFRGTASMNHVEYARSSSSRSGSESLRSRGRSSSGSFASAIYAPKPIGCCLTLISLIFSALKPLGSIFIVAVQLVVAFTIFRDHSVYFRLSIIFTAIPVLITSCYVSMLSWRSYTSRFDSDRITFHSGIRRKILELLLICPVINMILVLMPPPLVLIKNREVYTLSLQSIFIIILSIASAPNLIISWIYVLTMDNIPMDSNMYLILQISTCSVCLNCFAVIHYAYVRALDSMGEQLSMQNAIKMSLFWVKFDYFLQIYFYLYFLPVTLELVHFLPILLEYYFYDGITLQIFIQQMCVFNGAKLLCFAHYLWNLSARKTYNFCCNLLRFMCCVVILMPFPLVPFITTTYRSLFEKRLFLLDERKRRQQREARKTISDWKRQQQQESITRGPSSDIATNGDGAGIHVINGANDDMKNGDALVHYPSYESVRSNGSTVSTLRYEKLKDPLCKIRTSSLEPLDSRRSSTEPVVHIPSGRSGDGDDEGDTDEEIESPKPGALSELHETLLENQVMTPSVNLISELRAETPLNGYNGCNLHNGHNGHNKYNGHNTQHGGVNSTNGQGRKGYYHLKGSLKWLKAIRAQYYWLCLYCLIAYIGCDIWLMVYVDGGCFGMGMLTKILTALGFCAAAGSIVLYHPCTLRQILSKAQLELVVDVMSDIEDDERLSVSTVPI